MSNTNGVITVMEMHNVHYTEKPHAILEFKRNGFSVDDICIIRVSPNSYDMTAKRID